MVVGRYRIECKKISVINGLRETEMEGEGQRERERGTERLREGE